MCDGSRFSFSGGNNVTPMSALISNDPITRPHHNHNLLSTFSLHKCVTHRFADICLQLDLCCICSGGVLFRQTFRHVLHLFRTEEVAEMESGTFKELSLSLSLIASFRSARRPSPCTPGIADANQPTWPPCSSRPIPYPILWLHSNADVGYQMVKVDCAKLSTTARVRPMVVRRYSYCDQIA